MLLAIVGAATVTFSYKLAEWEARDLLDNQLRQIALNIDVRVRETEPIPTRDTEEDLAIGIWNASGDRARIASTAINLPLSPSPGFGIVKLKPDKWRVYVLYDGDRIVQVGQNMVVREELARDAALVTALPILITVPLAWLVIGLGLSGITRRLSKLAAAIAERNAENKQAIPLDEVPVEVRPLIDAMNISTVQLLHTLDQQRRFLSDAAHELRTPLSALMIQIDNLKNMMTAAHKPTITSELGAGIHRASALVDQMLRMARFDISPNVTFFEPVDLKAVILQCVADLNPIAANKGIDLGFTNHQDARAIGNESELRVLFNNLIDNAVKYTPEGGVIDVLIQTAQEQTIVQITDSGCGVKASELPRLFDRFFRGAHPDVQGSGLGLAIVDAIAKRHGFSVEIQNRRDRSGLQVTVACPGLIAV